MQSNSQPAGGKYYKVYSKSDQASVSALYGKLLPPNPLWYGLQFGRLRHTVNGNQT